MAITHTFVSGVEDGADETLVRPSNWNADHSGITIVLKASDETVNNSTDLQNDDELLLAVAANEIWELFVVIYTSGHTDSTGLQMQWTVPAGGVMYKVDSRDIGNVAANKSPLRGDATTSHYILVTGVATVYAHLVWMTYIGAGSAGNIQLQWAQSAAYAADTTVYANSYILAHRLV